MNDLISRQAAIARAVPLNLFGREVMMVSVSELENLPSAQPDVPDTNVGDMISRDAAMETLMTQNVIMDGSEYHNGFNVGINRAQEVIKNLPPVQPKQTNCEYCHTDRDGYVFPLEKNSHAFIDRDKIVLKANGWRGEAKIKYCPICGRRLTNGTD